MTVNIEKMRHDIRWENRKFLVSLVLAAAALLVAGVGIGNYFTKQAQPIVIQLPSQPAAPPPK